LPFQGCLAKIPPEVFGIAATTCLGTRPTLQPDFVLAIPPFAHPGGRPQRYGFATDSPFVSQNPSPALPAALHELLQVPPPDPYLPA
jgi:hypothetical protein